MAPPNEQRHHDMRTFEQMNAKTQQTDPGNLQQVLGTLPRPGAVR